MKLPTDFIPDKDYSEQTRELVKAPKTYIEESFIDDLNEKLIADSKSHRGEVKKYDKEKKTLDRQLKKHEYKLKKARIGCEAHLNTKEKILDLKKEVEKIEKIDEPFKTGAELSDSFIF